MTEERPDGRESVADRLERRVVQASAQRAELTAAISDVRNARSLTFADDEHDPEGSTLSLDQARDVALLARVEQSLAELSAAQERLTAGVYGICERCGAAITVARLTARPEARFCIACADRRDSPRSR